MSGDGKPTECPAQSVTPAVTKKTASARSSQVSGAGTRATSAMPMFQSERGASHTTSPSTGLARSRPMSELTLKAPCPASLYTFITGPSCRTSDP
jgi:hypothetical protein